MKKYLDNSIDSIVTSPSRLPSIEEWKECFRVLKPGAHLALLSEPKSYHRFAAAIEDAGFEIRDQIQFIHAHGSTPIVLSRKPLREKTVAKNVLKHGTGGLNIDGSRVGDEIIAQHQRDLSKAHGNNWAAGTPQPVTGVTNYTKGRFPANVIFDEAASRALDEQSGISKSSVRKVKPGETMAASMNHGKNKVARTEGGVEDSGGASRFFHKASSTAALIEYLTKLITPEAGLSLDPFKFESEQFLSAS